jgi:hypothetical protein
MDLSEWGITLREFCPRKANKGTTTTRSHVNKLPSLKNFRPAFATIVGNPNIMPIHARTLDRASHLHRGSAPKQIRVVITRSQICKWTKVSITSWVVFLFKNIYLYDLPSIVVCKQPPWTFDGNVYASWCPKLSLLVTSLPNRVWSCNLERLHLNLAHNFMNV